METPQTLLDAIEVKCRLIGAKADESFGDNEARNTYIVSIKHNGVEQSFKFTDSLDNTRKGIELDGTKNKADILEIFVSDYYTNKENYPTFKDFCDEFGYDNDSIRSQKIYKNCLEQARKLATLFTPEHIEQLRQEIEGVQN